VVNNYHFCSLFCKNRKREKKSILSLAIKTKKSVKADQHDILKKHLDNQAEALKLQEKKLHH
jgi:hypothetical protein